MERPRHLGIPFNSEERDRTLQFGRETTLGRLTRDLDIIREFGDKYGSEFGQLTVAFIQATSEYGMLNGLKIETSELAVKFGEAFAENFNAQAEEVRSAWAVEYFTDAAVFKQPQK